MSSFLMMLGNVCVVLSTAQMLLAGEFTVFRVAGRVLMRSVHQGLDITCGKTLEITVFESTLSGIAGQRNGTSLGCCCTGDKKGDGCRGGDDVLGVGKHLGD
jgi:hypothetical protein